MTKLRILIVDDEPLARDRLRVLLSPDATVEIAGEASNGTDALTAIGELQPDVVFLDMQMPGSSGLEVVARLSEPRPVIIFVTAHERFAVDAFAAEATDYLLKPCDRERLQAALKRARNEIAARRANDLGARLETLLSSRPADSDRIAVRSDGRVIFLRRREITWVEAANNYCVLHLHDKRRLMLRETLSAIEERLGSTAFARVNRSALVQIDEVKELQPSTYGDYIVVLQSGQRLPLSRNYRGRLERFAPHSF